MDKNILLKMVREAFDERNKGVGTSPLKLNGKKKQKYDREYAEVERALDDTILTKSQVMSVAGLGDPEDGGDRREFNAKVNREKNEDGSVRQFKDKELSNLVKVISNPKAYLTNKTNIKQS
jgi:hypothetical protein